MARKIGTFTVSVEKQKRYGVKEQGYINANKTKHMSKEEIASLYRLDIQEGMQDNTYKTSVIRNGIRESHTITWEYVAGKRAKRTVTRQYISKGNYAQVVYDVAVWNA